MNDTDEEYMFQEAVKALLFKGQKIPAIKKYREETGLGLKEAKEAVEAIERGLREEHPDQFIKPAGGCAPVVLFGFMSLGAVVAHFVA